jgi:hypothetical protein
MAMTTAPLQLTDATGALISTSASLISVGVVSTIPVRLNRDNFSLWKGLTVPNLSGANLHDHLDSSAVVPEKMVTQGTGDIAVTVANPKYHRWWVQDQKVLSLLLTSMHEDIAGQLIGCKIAAAAWSAVHAMYGAQSRANVRHIRRQLQSLQKDELSAA